MSPEYLNHQFADSPVYHLQRALEARHLANLTRAEVARALRALSSCYVTRRGKLASGAPLETAGKRAAFALYYGPLHFAVTSEIVRSCGFEKVRRIHDVGCGTGVAGAAWALENGETATISGVDRSAWAVEEATWLYRQFHLRGRARRGELTRAVRPPNDFRTGDALLFAYSLNELPEAARSTALTAVTEAARHGAALLVLEPVGRRLGNEGWWAAWLRALEPLGARQQDWRFPSTLLPQQTHDLGRAAGLSLKELTARTLVIAHA